MTVTRTYKTNQQGNAEIDFSNEENGDYLLSISSAESEKYEAKTVTRNIHIFNGYTTRILVNNSENTSFTGKYYDNTRLSVSLQYYDYLSETWKNKEKYNIVAEYNNQSVTLTDNNNVLDLSELNVKTEPYVVQLSFVGDRTYNATEKTIEYEQTKNTPVIHVAGAIQKYVDEEKSFNVILKTLEGNIIPNQEISFLKQDMVYTALTDENGVALFSASVSNDDLLIDVDEETHTLNVETAYTLPSLDYDEEYVLQLSFDTVLSITTSQLTLNFSENTLEITDEEYSKTVNFQEKELKLRITNHHGVYRIFNDMDHLYSKETTNNYPINILGDGQITKIQKNALYDGEIINYAECVLNCNSTNNLSSAEEVQITLENMELQKQSNIKYYVDGYKSNKVVTHYSSISFEHDEEYGYFIENNYFAQEDIYHVQNQSTLDIVFVNRSLNYCTKTNHVERNIELVDWMITDSDNFSLNGIGVHVSENVLIGTNTNISADLGIIGEQVSLIQNSIVIDTATTDSHGIAVFTISSATAGMKEYIIQYDGHDGFADASSDIFGINFIQTRQTNISLTKDSDAIFVDDTVHFTADLGFANKNIKFIVNNVLQETVPTETDGTATFTYTMRDAGDVTVSAVFTSDSELLGSESRVLCVVNKYPINLAVSTNKTLYYVGDDILFTANATIGDGIQFIVKNDEHDLVSSSTFHNNQSSVEIAEIEKYTNNDTETITFTCSNETSRKYDVETTTKAITVSKIPTSITVQSTTATPNTPFIFTLKDVYNNPLVDKQITAIVNNQIPFSFAPTDADGKVEISFVQKGTYSLKMTWTADDNKYKSVSSTFSLKVV